MRLPLLVVAAMLLFPLAAAGPAGDAAATLYAVGCGDLGRPTCEQMQGDVGYFTIRACRDGSPEPNNAMNQVHGVGRLASSVTEFAIGVDLCRGGLGAFANGTAAQVDALLP